MKKPPIEPVQQIQGWLYDYLTPDGGLDPYDFSHYVRPWAKQARVKVDDDTMPGDLTPPQLAKFKKWLIDQEKGIEFIEQDPAGSPAYLTLQDAKKLPVGTWCVHFTKADPFDTFDRGATLEGLHLSTWREKKEFVDCEKQLSGEIGDLEIVYGFAFKADERNILSIGKSKYGRNAVLFQTDGGVLAYHIGDEERQVIFPLCSEYNAIPLYDPSRGEIRIETDGGEELSFETLEDVIRYVETDEKRAVKSNPSGRLVRIYEDD